MKFSYSFDDIVGFSDIVGVPEDYDGSPTPRKLQSEFISPRPIPPNVLATAGVLAFRPFIEGKVSVDGEIDRPVAESLQSYLEQSFVHFSAVTFRPKDPNRRPNSALLNTTSSGLTLPPIDNSFDQDREFQLTFHDSSKRVGWSMDLPNIDIPSNAGAFAAPYAPFTREWWSPFIAVTVLFAEAFEIGTVRLPVFRGQGERALRDVLRSIDMRLVIG
ncbi:hypothetical protein [Corynebacterium sp. NML180780]|uniref:hypothetical protein n=1 Tax=Corynebacterium sp. NML180780 TaxID=2598459 RepID=UPI00118EE9C1|nr:hypothetical protein [Corynebacterium sp. NML180780]TVX76182.1 hypothetical protein FPP74_11445 [Corynebacterium sp. NML180780]